MTTLDQVAEHLEEAARLLRDQARTAGGGSDDDESHDSMATVIDLGPVAPTETGAGEVVRVERSTSMLGDSFDVRVGLQHVYAFEDEDEASNVVDILRGLLDDARREGLMEGLLVTRLHLEGYRASEYDESEKTETGYTAISRCIHEIAHLEARAGGDEP